MASAKATVTGLRSLLRFLYLDGQITVPLAGAVPSAACWQLAALPRAVSPADLARLMDSCDRDSAAGRRDFAILVLLARLGLRAGEVAALDLGDISWRQGEITVRGKGSRRDILPLPVDAGEAMASWLAEGRPREAACPAVFVRLRAAAWPARLHQRVVCRPPGLRPGRCHRGRGAPAAALHGDRHAGGRRDAGRDRAGSPARPARHDRDLRKDRRARAVAAGTAVAGRTPMSQLNSHIEDYLAMRRALGFKLVKEGRLLRDFAAFAEAAGAGTVTTDLAVAWSIMPQNVSPVWAAQRLSMVRGFARYLQAVDPATQVPPVGVLPARTRRVTPYIYSDAEVAALMTAARMLRNPLKAATFETVIGLLAVTGLRGSEAMALDGGDLDATAGLLTVRATKFRKSRQLPLQVTTLRALSELSGRA